MSAWEGFTSFETAFQPIDGAGVGAYLILLNLNDSGDLAVAEIRRCVQRSGANLTAELTEMFGQRNWRIHLVAAVGLLIAGATEERLEILWRAIQRPSWVSPQLAAAAKYLDPRFVDRTRPIIEGRCSFEQDQSVETNWMNRHSELGPSSFRSRSAKTLSALVALCSLEDELPWLAALKDAPDIRSMLASDTDHGDRIALEWLNKVKPLIAPIS